jgi:hypothetical protein
MTVMTLTLVDVGDGEVEVRVENDGKPDEGSLAARQMSLIIAWLEGDSLPDGYTVH